jgi:hypothetical protein
MFDGVFVELTNRRSDEPLARGTMPWQGIALLLGLTVLSVVAAILYPDVFGAALERF